MKIYHHTSRLSWKVYRIISWRSMLPLLLMWLQRKYVSFQTIRKISSCDECNYTTTEIGYLRNHIKSTHSKDQYPCYKCDYKAIMSHLKLYVILVHEGVVHPWDLCDKKVTKKNIFTATTYTFLYFPVQSIFLKFPIK